MLRVDQVVGAGRADLAHLGRARRGGERDRLRAAVDLEHDAVGVGEQRAAERGQRRGEERVGLRRRRARCTFRPPRPKPTLPASSSASGRAGDELERRAVASSLVSPQVTRPCFSSRTARAAGFSSSSSAIRLDMSNPGRW